MSNATQARRAEIKHHGRCLPGAREALERLAQTPGLVTGNIQPIARAKLEAFALGEDIDFDIGGYGSEDGDRATLARLALQRAKQKYEVTYLPEQTFVIGDTPYDITGATVNGMRATGYNDQRPPARQVDPAPRAG